MAFSRKIIKNPFSTREYAGRETFVGRERQLEAILGRMPGLMILRGYVGSGKTSVLVEADKRLKEERRDVVIVSIGGRGNLLEPMGLVYRICNSAFGVSKGIPSTYREAQQRLDRLEKKLEDAGRFIYVFVDNIDREVGILLDALRFFTDRQLRFIKFVFALVPKQIRAIKEQDENLVKQTTQETIGSLSQEEADKLIDLSARAGKRVVSDAREAMHLFSGNMPYFLQRLLEMGFDRRTTGIIEVRDIELGELTLQRPTRFIVERMWEDFDQAEQRIITELSKSGDNGYGKRKIKVNLLAAKELLELGILSKDGYGFHINGTILVDAFEQINKMPVDVAV